LPSSGNGGKSRPTDAEIILLPEFDHKLKEFNMELSKDAETAGSKVVYISIKEIRPKVLSRIEKIEMEPLVNNRLPPAGIVVRYPFHVGNGAPFPS
jgi:hypothetical protein